MSAKFATRLSIAATVMVLAVPGVSTAQDGGVGGVENDCWLGEMTVPALRQYKLLEAERRSLEFRLKSHPDETEVIERLDKANAARADLMAGRGAARKMFVTGGQVPVKVTSRAPFQYGERVEFQVQSCDVREIPGYCSEDAATELAGETLSADIEGIGVFARDKYFGFVQLTLMPTIDGERGKAAVRVQYVGPTRWGEGQSGPEGASCAD